MLFRHAFDAAPTCSPSRAALLTGMAPHSCGMLGLAHRGFALSDASRHLARYLRSQGYLTALAGIQHEMPAARVSEMGYERILRPASNQGPAVAAPLPDTPATRRDMAAFHASARMLDASMGTVLEALARRCKCHDPTAHRHTSSSLVSPS